MQDQDFKSLIDKVKSQDSKTIIQKVLPVIKDKKDEIQFSFYLDKKLLKKLKIYSVDKEISIKEIINNSIIQYLDKSH